MNNIDKIAISLLVLGLIGSKEYEKGNTAQAIGIFILVIVVVLVCWICLKKEKTMNCFIVSYKDNYGYSDYARIFAYDRKMATVEFYNIYPSDFRIIKIE